MKKKLDGYKKSCLFVTGKKKKKVARATENKFIAGGGKVKVPQSSESFGLRFEPSFALSIVGEMGSILFAKNITSLNCYTLRLPKGRGMLIMQRNPYNASGNTKTVLTQKHKCKGNANRMNPVVMHK